MSELNKHILHI